MAEKSATALSILIPDLQSPWLEDAALVSSLDEVEKLLHEAKAGDRHDLLEVLLLLYMLVPVVLLLQPVTCDLFASICYLPRPATCYGDHDKGDL